MSTAFCYACEGLIDTDADNYEVSEGVNFICEICTEIDDE